MRLCKLLKHKAMSISGIAFGQCISVHKIVLTYASVLGFVSLLITRLGTDKLSVITRPTVADRTHTTLSSSSSLQRVLHT
jgi:hypothetical protein